MAIVDGYGDYILVERDQHGALRAPNWATYDAAYTNTLHVNSPQFFIHQQRQLVAAAVDPAAEESRAASRLATAIDGRYQVIRRALAPAEVVFIPRTLYELIYINELMTLEVEQAFGAWGVNPIPRWSQVNAAGPNHADPAISLLAPNRQLCHALNTVVVARLRQLPDTQTRTLPLKRRALDLLVEAEVTRFREHIRFNRVRLGRYPCPAQPGLAGVPAGLSLGDRLHGSQMRAHLDTIVGSIRACVGIELAYAGHQLLYRASEFAADDVSVAPNVLSYNTSLFATLVYDRNFNTSTPEFMVQDNRRTGRCVVIPYADMVLRSFPFYVPLGNTIDQLHGVDQQAHAWTKANLTWACGQLFIAPPSAAAFAINAAGTHWIDMLYHVDDRAALARMVLHYPRVQWHPQQELVTAHLADGLQPFRWSGSTSRGIRCSRCESTHGDRVSSVLGRWHQCSACDAVYCNVCAKWYLSRSSWSLSRTRACSCGGETTLIQ